jgi:uncharacterized protein (DUF488 family)
MDITICTIGFAGKTAEEFFRLLLEAKVHKLIDVRENRGGQLSGFAKYPDLAFFLQRVAGIQYAYEPLLAPTPEIRKTYRKGKDWAVYEADFLALMRTRGIPEALAPTQFEGTVALLCSEAMPDKCHRRLVAELLSAHWRTQGHGVEIRHLATDGRSTKRKRRAHTK